MTDSVTTADPALSTTIEAGFTAAATAAGRARLRADVAVAARGLPTHYPLRSFIAVNPLSGLEGLPFGQALRRAGELYGSRGTLPETTYRAAHAAGRITDADLRQALARRYPDGPNHPAVRLGPRQHSAVDILLADLKHGPAAPDPVRVWRTRAEHTAPGVAAQVDAQAGKWCAAFVGADNAGWPMPGHADGLYRAWRQLAHHDLGLPRAVRRELRAVADRADDAALHALALLQIGSAEQRDYLTAHLTRLPGWAAHLHWRNSRHDSSELLDYLAIRLSYEALLLAHDRHLSDPFQVRSTCAPTLAPVADQRADIVARVLGRPGSPAPADVKIVADLLVTVPVEERALVWQEAYEGHYGDALLSALERCPASSAGTHERSGPTLGRPSAQVVCCIDARSEGLRRRLEACGAYETLGFAGFFAVAIRYTDLAGGASDDLCPVLIDPAYRVQESSDQEIVVARRLAGLGALAGAEAGFSAAKNDLLSPFALAEAAGWFAGPFAAGKTFSPRASGALRTRLHRLVAPQVATRVGVDTPIPLPDRVLYAQVALATMGLTQGFARLVVLCGHGSTTENNPYKAALDCGACGGHRGGPNARTAAAILNDPAVRTALTERGIDIPADTWFAAAEHDTATDRVTLLDPHLIPESHRPDTAQVTADLTMAGQELAMERCGDLPGAPGSTRRGRGRARLRPRAVRHVRARSLDWAQVYPEWGLARNAAFIVGPRHLTGGLDLQRRAFLHSYDPAVDPDGTALETILTAPLVVAQWINAQYYFSTVDPTVFGAGTKTIHNVIAGAGVLAGHDGDLQLGLPWQSVAHGTDLVHEPMRLLTVIQAPLNRIQTIIDRNPILQDLTGHQWVTVAAREHPAQPWQRHTAAGWRPWSPTAE